MAQTSNSLLLHRVSGQIGKQVVIKQYGSKTVISAYPDMSGIQPTDLQLSKREKFAAAVAYARSIIQNPALKATFAQKLPKGKRVFNAAIQAYLARNK